MLSLRSNWPSHAALAAGLIATAVAVSVLVAWQLHLPLLLQVLPTLAPMHRTTAFAVAAGGMAMVCAALFRTRAAVLFAIVTLLLAVLSLAEYLFSTDLGVDLLLGPDYLNVHTSSPGRMSPASASCLLGYSLAVIVLCINGMARWASAAAGMIGSSMLAVGSVSIWAVLLLRREVFDWADATQLSLPSSITYALLGCGLLALARQERRGRASGWAPFAIGLSGAAAVVGVWQAVAAHSDSDWLPISNVVLAGGLLMALLLAVAVHQTQRARKHAEELRRSQEQFREIFEQSPIGITLVSRDFHVIKANAAYSRMLGYSAEELASMTPLDYTHPEDQQITHEALERFFEKAALIQKMEKRYLTKGGEMMWVAITTRAIHDLQGKPLYSIGMIEDITERKRIEDERRTLTQRLSLATRSASMGVWDWNMKTNLSIWDDMMFQIFGLPKRAVVPRQDWVRLIHPEDRPKVMAFSVAIFQGRTPDEVEFRITRPDGVVRHVSALGGPVLVDQSVVGMVGIAIDITERKEEEERLRALSTRFAQATQFASMAVWEWDPRTQNFVWDDTAFALTGLPKADFVHSETWQLRIHPDDRAANAGALERILREKTQVSLEFRFYRPDGTWGHMYAAGGPVLDRKGEVVRVVGIAIDITERKREEERLRALTTRFAQATHFAFMSVWEWHPSTRVFVWDDTSFAVTGILKADFVPHQTWAQMVHPDDLAEAEATLHRIVRNKTQESVEYRLVLPDGSVRHLYSAGGPVVDSNGEVIRVVGITIDITERKRLEADLEASREQAVASARLSALGMMAGGVAHEINNPLSIIHAMASDLVEMVSANGSLSPQVVLRKSTVIRETAERIAKIVKSLRLISREGSGDTFHPTPVAKIVGETLQICLAKFAANGVELILPSGFPEMSISCREVQIAQALLNLLQNAFDAVLERDGERWVRLEVEPRDGVVAISVIDSGPGVPLELRPRVMEPFFTTKPVGKGTGLGLSLTKTIAEDHGGSLEYGEDQGHTRFSLVLPQARKAEAA